MKIKIITLSMLMSFSCSCFIAAQTLQNDTVVEGDLDVQVDANGDKGFLNVDGRANLGLAPLPMPNAIAGSGLTEAWQYGPVITSGQNYQVTYKFVKTAAGGDRISDLPLGYTFNPSGAEVFASINDGSTHEGADWSVKGSRHRTIKCMNHSAYGNGRYFSLKGSMHHGKMMMFLDYDRDLIAGKTYTIQVTVNYRAGRFDADASGFSEPLTTDYAMPSSLSAGNSIQPVLLLESKIFEKYEDYRDQRGEAIRIVKYWNGSEMILGGQVILSEPQGDISMGAFGE